MISFKKNIAWVITFAIAMGFLESAVVIYLRELYYPEGFQFPLKIIPAKLGRVEFLRELATVVMLVGIGVLAGRTKLERFAYFVLAFAVWDIFYYVFLYLCLGWPESLATWDILFLIPLPWVGPVWAPCLLCVLMITGAFYILRACHENLQLRIPWKNWFLMIGGALVCILAFVWDYLTTAGSDQNFWSLFSSEHLFAEIRTYVPTKFNGVLFFIGFLAMLLSVLLFILKSKSNEKHV